jgi:hypothetical protein
MPVSSINFQGSDINLPSRNGTSALYTPLFRKWLSDIMYGETKHDWAVVVDNIEE